LPGNRSLPAAARAAFSHRKDRKTSSPSRRLYDAQGGPKSAARERSFNFRVFRPVVPGRRPQWPGACLASQSSHASGLIQGSRYDAAEQRTERIARLSRKRRQMSRGAAGIHQHDHHPLSRPAASQTQTSAAWYARLSIGVRAPTCFIELSSLLGSDNIPFTQEVKAEMLSVQRSSVSDAISKLEAAGIIAHTRGVIQLLDRDRVLKLAHPAIV
jgi:hypothetical protein